jgi:hypothetical protein
MLTVLDKAAGFGAGLLMAGAIVLQVRIWSQCRRHGTDAQRRTFRLTFPWHCTYKRRALRNAREELRRQRQLVAAHAGNGRQAELREHLFPTSRISSPRTPEVGVPGDRSPEHHGRGALPAHVHSLNAHQNARLVTAQLSKPDAIEVYKSWHAIYAQLLDLYLGFAYRALRALDSPSCRRSRRMPTSCRR